MSAILTGNERTFSNDEFLVSKTDPRGIITYANTVFTRVCGYTEQELLGKPHNIIRHPHMPRCVFKLFWEHLERGDEVFAYVINRCKNGDHYWVHAHCTVSRDQKGAIVALHSNRRVPNKNIVHEKVIPLYKNLCDIESGEKNSNAGMDKAYHHLLSLISGTHGKDYNAWLFGL